MSEQRATPQALLVSTILELVKTMSALEHGQREVLSELRAIRALWERVHDDEEVSPPAQNGSATPSAGAVPNGSGIQQKLERILERKLGGLDDSALEMLLDGAATKKG